MQETQYHRVYYVTIKLNQCLEKGVFHEFPQEMIEFPDFPWLFASGKSIFYSLTFHKLTIWAVPGLLMRNSYLFHRSPFTHEQGCQPKIIFFVNFVWIRGTKLNRCRNENIQWKSRVNMPFNLAGVSPWTKIILFWWMRGWRDNTHRQWMFSI